ncbi:LacI family DNA-binding transcriptional regulator [Paenibacillus silviterrae]|uniref:LacI family DNA-binding transcriptional regulator n=1 Tax=Paenibacillus silviterrae TaxID=3242194 RepID=UPI002543601E|nr:LacI family DNA-binding transcriptional regulator [Paenibacillus chinjuensis]
MSKLDEVAKLAGVSKATVSRVINNSETVSSAARQKVLDALQALQFQPHELKRSSSGGGNGVLGMILPFGKQIWGHSFGIEILAGAEEKAFEQDCLILLGNSNGGRETALTGSMIGRGIEGLIVMSSERGQREHLQQVQAHGIPLVLVDQKVEGLGAHLVRGDSFMGAVTLMTHLIGQGHRRIGLVSPNKHYTYTERIKGYRYALMEHNIPSNARFEALESDEQPAAGLLSHMLDADERPSALFVTSPGMLGTVISVLNQKRLRIPDDISLVTFDESYTALPEEYKSFFTSINQSGKLIGTIAVELLFRQQRDPELEPQEIVLPGTFTARSSVRPLL